MSRDDRGAVTDLDWAGTIRRWSQDYELRRANAVTSYLDARGLPDLTKKLATAKWRYAVTTSLAAQRFAPIAPTRLAVVYVDDVLDASDRLKLRPAEAGANVLLAEPYDEVAFERTQPLDGLITVAPCQVAVDMLTGPGHEPSEAEELIDWMTKNEHAWRT